MAKNKKNTSKKFPKNVAGSLPYFLINSTGQIQHFADGGDLFDGLGSLSGGGIGGTVGNTIAGMIGGNTNVADDRNATKEKAVIGGVFSGAGTGLDIGSKFGPIGGALGLIGGGIAGGANAGAQKNKEINAFGESMRAKYAGNQPNTVEYYGADGGYLPITLADGGPITPLSKEAAENNVSVMYDQWNKFQSEVPTDPKQNPLYEQQRAEWDQRFIDFQTNHLTPNELTLDLERMGSKVQHPTTNSAVNIDPQVGTATTFANDPTFNQTVLDDGTLSSERNFAEGGDLNMPEMPMSGEPTEFNGMKHEEGGLKIGSAEVEDGEIRVGDYVFSDRLTGADGKTFAEAAKKVTKKYEEYENDGPAMRTQSKQLEEIKFNNDQARLLKQKEEAQLEIAMGEDFKAYGGMIAKDSRNKFVVDKSNRMELMGAAKNRKMSYNKYLESVHAYGGKLYGGGDLDPEQRKAKHSYTSEADRINALSAGIPGIGSGANPADLANLPGLDMSTPNAPMNYDLMGGAGDAVYARTGPGGEIGDLPTRDAKHVSASGGTPYGTNPINLHTSDMTLADLANQYEASTTEGGEKRFGNEEQALLSSQLPNVSQLLMASKKNNTRFDRVNLKEINLNKERGEVDQAIDKARGIQRENVRGTASSAGDALAAMSAGNAGLTRAGMNAKAGISERERNMNIQTDNQESLTNTGIANQETIARQQDEGMRDSVKQLALSGMSDNYQGYIKDKKLSKENKASNKRLMSLLDTGEYKITEDGDGGYKVVYNNTYKKED